MAHICWRCAWVYVHVCMTYLLSHAPAPTPHTVPRHPHPHHRAVQEELLALLRDVRLPALLAASAEAERQAAEAAEEEAAAGGGVSGVRRMAVADG